MSEQEIIDEINLLSQAIKAIYEGAQEYNIGSRAVKKADLNALLAERRRLISDLALIQSNGGRSVASWIGR